MAMLTIQTPKESTFQYPKGYRCKRKDQFTLLCIHLAQTDQEVPRNLKTEPAARHARSNFEQVWYYSLVEAAYALLRKNNGDGVADGLVLIS